MRQQETKKSLPVGWERVALEGLGSWAGGGTPSKAVADYWTGGHIPWVSPKDMKTHRIRETPDYITESAVRDSATQVIAAGSVLTVTRSGILKHTFPVAITDVPVAVNQDLRALTPHRGIDAEYVAYAFRAFGGDILNTCSKGGTTVQNIETPRLLRYEVPLAPAPEQPRIVSAIETQFPRLDAAVATLERVQANLKRYRASVLKAAVEGRLVPTEAELARRDGRDYEPASVLLERILKERRRKWEEAELAKMKANSKPSRVDGWKAKYKEPAGPDIRGLRSLPIGWCWASVESLCASVTDGDHQPPPQVDSGVPFLVIGNISGGRMDLSRTRFVSRGYYDLLDAARRPRRGDVLYSVTGSFGIPVLVDSVTPFCVQRHIAILRPCPLTNRGFMSHVLASDFVFRQADKIATGTAQKTVPLTGLRRIVVPLPPVAEQVRIVEEIDRRLSLAEELTHVACHSWARSARLRQAVLKWAFDGRLVDQDPTDEPASALLERIKAEREHGDDEPPTRKPRGRRKKVIA